MTSTNESLKKSKISDIDKLEILKAFSILEKRRNESIPEEVQEQWINDLENSDLSVTKILERITSAGLRTDIYGKLKLTDILQSGDSILDMDLIINKAVSKLNEILEFKNYSLDKFQIEYREHLNQKYLK